MTGGPWSAAAAEGPDHEAFERLLSVLVPGEEIVWTGRADRIAAAAGMAKTCLLLAATTAAMLAAVVLLEGWFVFLQFFALVPAFGTVVTLPLTLYDLIVAGRTWYAVTTERVLVVRAWPRRSVEILMPAWIVEVRRKSGIGGRQSLEIRQTEVSGVRRMFNVFLETHQGPVLTLHSTEGIESALSAVDRLRSWRMPPAAPELRPADAGVGGDAPVVLEDPPEVDPGRNRSWAPDPGEKIVWSGPPSPRAVALNGLRSVLKLAAIAVGMVTVGTVILVLSDNIGPVLILGWLSLVPGLGAIGSLIQAGWDGAAAIGRRFVITDARVVVVDDWPRKRVQYLLPAPGLSVERKRRSGERGTIFLHAARPATDAAVWDRLHRVRGKTLLAMHGIPNVDAATAALDALIAGVGNRSAG
ncbi:hypothetical protein [Thalassobaculum sp.]|uniref:hypothetical protein n=1 Tax=Thalassobaculum sp. TaxID=2022740 RepID=UPI0032EE17C4